jgi:hypothetical protein
MSSSQNLQAENANNADNSEDVSVPTLSSDSTKFKGKPSKLIYLNRSLSSSRRAPKAQSSTLQEIYHTRESERGLGLIKGFMDLPMDVVFEVSLRSLQNTPVGARPGQPQSKLSSRLPCISIQGKSYIFPGSRSNLGLCLHLALLFSSGKLLIVTPI